MSLMIFKFIATMLERVQKLYLRMGIIVGLFSLSCVQIGAASISAPLWEHGQQEVKSQLVANVNAQRQLSLELKNKTLVESLHILAKKTKVGLSLQSESIPDKRISLTLKNVTVYQALDELLKDTDLEAVLPSSRDVIIIKPKEDRLQKIQMETVRGTVVDAQSGEPLPGVNVVVPGTSIGTATNPEGRYELQNIPSDAESLEFTFIGYETLIVDINERTVIDVELSPRVGELGEMVVIGYGERDRKDLTGSISTVSSDRIEQSLAVSPDLALQGLTAGVFISGVSGNPLERPQIRIRGVSTFGVADPLIVIDGVPVTEFGAGAEGSGAAARDLRGDVNIFSLVNPDDIASISVLKDASAAAVYGVRAANGVILITTKRGSEGSPQIEVNLSRGVQNIPGSVDVLGVQQYTELYQESFENNPDLAGTMPDVFDSNSPDYLGNRSFYNWQEAYKNENAISEDYNLRVSGGDASTTYYLSAGFVKSEGTIVGNELKRRSLAANVNSNISDRIKTGVTYRLGYVNALNNLQGASIEEGSLAPPWQPIYDSDGPMGYATVVEDGDLRWGPQTRFNRLAWQHLNESSSELVRNMGSAFVEVEPIQNLLFRGTLNVDWYQQTEHNYSDILQQHFSTTGSVPNTAEGSVGRFGERKSTNSNITREISVNYVNDFGKHSVNLLANALRQEYGVIGTDASGRYIPNRNPEQRFIQRTGDPEDTQSFHWLQEDALMGIMGRLSYNYDSRYYLDATVRRDGTSRFAPDYRWGTFPSVSMAWRVSSEDFMNRFEFISDLKLRGGWGQLGNQETSRFAYISTVGQQPMYTFGARDGDPTGNLVNGIRLPDFPSEELTWEVVTTINAGLDAVLFNDRLSFTAEYYNRVTDGILQSVAVARSVGNEHDPIFNVASVLNRGFEFQVGYNGMAGPVNYNISGNLTTVNNEVLELADGLPFGDNFGRIEEGYPLGYLWGYKVGGIFQNPNEVDEWLANNSEPGADKATGDIWYQDIGSEDGGGPDGVIDANDRTYLGSTIPGYYYGLNMNFMYKGLDLSLFFQGVGDIQKYNFLRRGGEGMDSNGVNQWASVVDRWTPENPSTTMPRAVHGDPGKNLRISDRFVEDADYFRLKNFQLGYTLQPELLSRLGIGTTSKYRLYVSGSNLFTVTNWSGIDPENDYIPPARVFTIGVNVSFR